MPAISFSVFKDKILNGSKTQTIRKRRKRAIKVGETLYLYWKQRTKECEKLGVSPCVALAAVEIYEDCYLIDWDIPTKGCGELVSDPSELNKFAIADGFNDWQHLKDWFDKTHGLPFEGDLIGWQPLGGNKS